MSTLELLGIKRTARAITRRAYIMKAAIISASGLIAITGVTYVIAMFYNSAGSFTVSLDRYDMLQTGLTLSETQNFEHPIDRLVAKPLVNVDNISVNDLPDDLDKTNGQHNNDNYLAYTFYLKNTGEKACTYQAAINIVSATNGIDNAVRIRVYKNGEYADYAKPKLDGSGPEPGTVPFPSQTVAYQTKSTDFEPGSIDKYTVVVWLEGDDPECTDSILGGILKMQMNFKAVPR